MAKEVASVQEIKLLDGTEVTLRPASITVLKKIMKSIKKLDEIKDANEDAVMDVLVDTSAVALRKQLPDVTEWLDLKPEDDEYEAKREEYTDMIDMEIVNLVNEVCGGIKFNDPNQVLAAMEAAGKN